MRVFNWRVLASQYGVALLSVGAMLAFKLAIDASFVGMQESPFLLALGAVVVSAWYGGRGPGLFATLLSGVVIYYCFFQPANSFLGRTWDADVRVSLFLLEGAMVSFLAGVLRQSEARKSAILATATDAMSR